MQSYTLGTYSPGFVSVSPGGSISKILGSDLSAVTLNNWMDDFSLGGAYNEEVSMTDAG